MKKILFIIITLVLGILIRLWFGIYHHDEYAETHLFFKHRPILKWTFYSPIGMSNLELDDLNEEERREELLFEEFVTSKGMSK
ncbi:hypothetical protein H7F15_13575 [Pontibacter sp. Tf4]|uniref:hypothetical protein n=1 Tax=Pontibacter sp. Tf4 TaxID=2761620 RepID=UPI001627DDD7|nr:hypothetical protein [Pontibacter sp. Tf4]MBB6612074.1 hypothetical protein [Pontibacter sp. Tf4]